MAIVGLKFFKRNLFACLQEVTSSLRLFKVASSGLQMMKYFSHRHKLQRFETGLKGVVCFRNFPGDPELQLCLLQISNVFTELCTQSLAGVVERRFVVGKSRFKRGLREPHISLV